MSQNRARPIFIFTYAPKITRHNARKGEKMRDITVTFEDGNTISTSINGSEETIREYYIGNRFQFGDTEEHPTDKMVKAVAVEFH
tara:strand:+ start:615 stop:869 length:255 start_codon:yes stop_codon:yes gene_type:complete